MVARQLEARGIRDPRVLQAMRAVPREEFVPPELVEFAYEDSPLPIAEQQTISQPYIVAAMIEALQLDQGSRILEVGTGSGYAAAVLAMIAARVYTIERHAGLATAAAARLEQLNIRNVQVRTGDGSLGWPEHAPFDGIVVAAGGPDIPEALIEQLAIGGRLVIPVGATPREQTLVRIQRTGPDSLSREDLGPVRFVPLIGAQAWEDESGRRPRVRPDRLGEIVAAAAQPFDRTEDPSVHGVLERTAGTRVVLLGEASHGTADFYQLRARITRALIEQGGVTIVAVEADWPDARRIDRYVRDGVTDPHVEAAFTRFPTWMWANRQVLDFAEWLRGWNTGQDPERQAGFYGLDLYSLYTSIRSTLAYLDQVDPEAAVAARSRYACLSPWEGNPAAYGAAVLRGHFEGCRQEVVSQLGALLHRRLEYETRDGERFFNAERNARLIASAEAYYRSMYYGSRESWNLRDRHMFETLDALLQHHGPDARAVVWAHNSHLGDARATEMGARGELNLGELCRTRFGEDAYLVGFGTDRGTVAAAHDWDGPMQIMAVRPSHERSYERVCHETGIPGFFLPFRTRSSRKAREALAPERLERAIGVIYRPDSELQSHYFYAELPHQFDEWIWIDQTRAVDPLPVPASREGLPETWPFGV